MLLQCTPSLDARTCFAQISMVTVNPDAAAEAKTMRTVPVLILGAGALLQFFSGFASAGDYLLMCVCAGANRGNTAVFLRLRAVLILDEKLERCTGGYCSIEVLLTRAHQDACGLQTRLGTQ